MLYAPAECDWCGAVFVSGVVIAEQPGDPSSYRKVAGPCPRCNSDGTVPPWVFTFHRIIADARDQATAQQIDSLISALRRHRNSDLLALDAMEFSAEPLGPWRAVAAAIHHSPAVERPARLALLEWTLDPSRAPGLSRHSRHIRQSARDLAPQRTRTSANDRTRAATARHTLTGGARVDRSGG